MIVCIAGSRHLFVDDEQIKEALEAINFNSEADTIIQGGAPGIDECAKMYALDREISHIEYKADWNDISKPDAVIKINKFGKRYNAKAGHDRNAMMAEDADILILFWTGKSPGSKNMKIQMIALNKLIHEIIING